MWQLLIGWRSWFQGFSAEFTAEERVAPLYIYEGRGSISIISSPSIKLSSHSLKM